MKKLKVLVTGGCGFIGCNAAARLMALGHDVTIYDNLSRPLTNLNLEWLHGIGAFQHVKGDLRDGASLTQVVKTGGFDAILHLAAQVAVTTSIADPQYDFEVNAGGTFNLLEAVRLWSARTILLYASTNKVYGKLGNVTVEEGTTRYTIPDLANGVGEGQPLDFHSPYGCSKGCADQYVADYARIFGLRTVNLRQSCIYGRRQFGVEDQGWVAWFAIAHTIGKPITIYGNGKQVRDILFVDDLVDCYLACIHNIDKVAGRTFNVGGGPANSLSLLELITILRELSGRAVQHSFSDWRPGDQPVFISNIDQVRSLTGWSPKIDARAGIANLFEWISANRSMFTNFGGKL